MTQYIAFCYIVNRAARSEILRYLKAAEGGSFRGDAGVREFDRLTTVVGVGSPDATAAP